MRHFEDNDVIRPELLAIRRVEVRHAVGVAQVALGRGVVLPARADAPVPVDEHIIGGCAAFAAYLAEGEAARAERLVDLPTLRPRPCLRGIEIQRMLECQPFAREAAEPCLLAVIADAGRQNLECPRRAHEHLLNGFTRAGISEQCFVHRYEFEIHQASAAHRSHMRWRVAAEDRREAGHAAFDLVFPDDIRLVQPTLWAHLRRKVGNLDQQVATVHGFFVRVGQPGQRVEAIRIAGGSDERRCGAGGERGGGRRRWGRCRREGRRRGCGRRRRRSWRRVGRKVDINVDLRAIGCIGSRQRDGDLRTGQDGRGAQGEGGGGDAEQQRERNSVSTHNLPCMVSDG